MADSFLTSQPFATPRFRNGFKKQVEGEDDPFNIKNDSFFNFTQAKTQPKPPQQIGVNQAQNIQRPQVMQQQTAQTVQAAQPVQPVQTQPQPQQQPQAFNLQDSELFKLAQGNIQSQLTGNIADQSAFENQQRELLKAAQAMEQRKLREQIVNSGLRDTGSMLDAGTIQPNEQVNRDKIALENTLAAEKARKVNEIKNSGIQNATNLMGLLQSGNIQEKQLQQQASQFKDELSFKKWATQAGFDDNSANRLWQSMESSKQIGSQEKIAFANLSLGEKQLYQQAEQFNSKLDFDKWAKTQDISEADKQRVWTAIQQDKQLAGQKEIANMQIDAEKWKQSRVEELTKLGWTHEQAMQKTQQEHDSVMREADRLLQREIEAGRLTMEDKKLVQQASQFKDELSFKKWAEENNIDMQKAKLAWEKDAFVKDQVFKSQQADYDRQLQKYIAEKGFSLDQQKLAQDAAQFKDKMAFDKWATEKGFSQKDKEMAWQASESAKQMAHESQMQQIEIAFKEKGMNFNAIMEYAKTLPPDQAAQVMHDAAVKAGITYTASEKSSVLLQKLSDVSQQGRDKNAFMTEAKKLGLSDADANELFKSFSGGGMKDSYTIEKPGFKPTVNPPEDPKQKEEKMYKQNLILNDFYKSGKISSSDYAFVKQNGTFEPIFQGQTIGNNNNLTNEFSNWASNNAGKIIKGNSGELYFIPLTAKGGGFKSIPLIPLNGGDPIFYNGTQHT